MTVELRRIETHAEYRAVEQLQRDVWHLEDVEIIPDHLLLTAQKNGGLVLGAFDGQQLVGFVFGFAGLTSDGRVKHCSHMAGVAPAYQNQNLGYWLKLAQREHVLAQGIDLITWTFDPLESRNARLNFHKLGATCCIYLRDLYGGMRDELNVGLPSDRFQVDWHVASQRVVDRLRGSLPADSLADLLAGGVHVINQPREEPGSLPAPPATTEPLDRGRVLIRIPADFQAIKTADMALARDWRLHTRTLFEAAFARGYVVTDLLFDGRQSCYLLERIP